MNIVANHLTSSVGSGWVTEDIFQRHESATKPDTIFLGMNSMTSQQCEIGSLKSLIIMNSLTTTRTMDRLFNYFVSRWMFA